MLRYLIKMTFTKLLELGSDYFLFQLDHVAVTWMQDWRWGRTSREINVLRIDLSFPQQWHQHPSPEWPRHVLLLTVSVGSLLRAKQTGSPGLRAGSMISWDPVLCSCCCLCRAGSWWACFCWHFSLLATVGQGTLHLHCELDPADFGACLLTLQLSVPPSFLCKPPLSGFSAACVPSSCTLLFPHFMVERLLLRRG